MKSIEVFEAIRALVKQADGAKTFTVDGRHFLVDAHGDTKELPLKEEPHPDLLSFARLASLAAYIVESEQRDDLDMSEMFVTVTPYEVSFIGPLIGERLQRRTYAIAKHSEPTQHKYGQALDQEAALIYLNTAFEPNQGSLDLVKLVTSIREESITTSEDDGVSQVVEAREGASLSKKVQVVNPVVLKPYRTFREISQQETPFYVRLVRNPGKLPSFQLQPIQDDQWKLKATAEIRELLVKALTPSGGNAPIVPVLD